jgi:UPF0755 protein
MTSARRGKRVQRLRKSARSFGRALAVVIALVAIAALGALGWLVMVYAEQHGPGRGKLVELSLEPDVRLRTIAYRLAGAGAIESPALFEAYAGTRLTIAGGSERRLRSGTVALYDDMTPAQVLQRIAHGFGAASLRVVVPEGYSRFDIAQRLHRFGICSAQGFLAATEDAALLRQLGIEAQSAEGFLFPDTYSLREGSEPHALVRRFVEAGRQRLQPLFAEHGEAFAALQRELSFTQRDVLTLASIVEKEAGVAEERPVIAGVFLNRLRSPSFTPKRLQADPTVAYGCRAQPLLASCSGFVPARQRITKAMLADADNRYNTYRIEGLPPGPISNPGLAAVRAVLAPSRHDYLYFVAKGGGRHTFSATLEAHNSAVSKQRP